MTRGKQTKTQLLTMALELHPWRFEQKFFPGQLPYRHVFEPKLIAQQGAICEAFFSKCFVQSTSWYFGSHFFAARFHQFIATCHCHFLVSFLERKLFCRFFTATNCNTLARHALKFARLLSIQFCFFCRPALSPFSVGFLKSDS